MAGRRAWILLSVAALLLCGLWALLPLSRWLAEVNAIAASAPFLAVTVFAIAYIVGALTLAPATPFAIAGGWLWGVNWGFLAVFFIGLIADIVPYLVARRLGRAPALSRHRVSSHSSTLAGLQQYAERQGFVLVLLVRWFPLAPFNLMNYLLALAGVRPHAYIWGTAVACLPTTFVCVYAGTLIPASKNHPEFAASWTASVSLLAGATVVVLGLSYLSKRYLERTASREALA